MRAAANSKCGVKATLPDLSRSTRLRQIRYAILRHTPVKKRCLAPRPNAVGNATKGRRKHKPDLPSRTAQCKAARTNPPVDASSKQTDSSQARRGTAECKLLEARAAPHPELQTATGGGAAPGHPGLIWSQTRAVATSAAFGDVRRKAARHPNTAQLAAARAQRRRRLSCKRAACVYGTPRWRPT